MEIEFRNFVDDSFPADGSLGCSIWKILELPGSSFAQQQRALSCSSQRSTWSVMHLDHLECSKFELEQVSPTGMSECRVDIVGSYQQTKMCVFNIFLPVS